MPGETRSVRPPISIWARAAPCPPLPGARAAPTAPFMPPPTASWRRYPSTPPAAAEGIMWPLWVSPISGATCGSSIPPRALAPIAASGWISAISAICTTEMTLRCPPMPIAASSILWPVTSTATARRALWFIPRSPTMPGAAGSNNGTTTVTAETSPSGARARAC